MIGSLALCLAVPHQHEKGWLGLALTSWALPGDSGHIPSSCLHAASPPPKRQHMDACSCCCPSCFTHGAVGTLWRAVQTALKVSLPRSVGLCSL